MTTQKDEKRMKIKLTQTKDGRWFAEYINPADLMVNGIGQFGFNPFEAEVNLLALLYRVREEQNKTVVKINVEAVLS